MITEEIKDQFLSMYKHLGLIKGQALSVQSYGSLKYEFIDRRYVSGENEKELLNTMVNDDFIDQKMVLTEKGELRAYK